MMRCHCIDDNWILLILLTQIHTEFYVRTFYFVID